MARIPLADGLSLHCAVDDYLWPWQSATPVVMLHGFARNARFWNRWVPTLAATRRLYRPELIGCGDSDVPAPGYRPTPEAIAGQIIAVFDALGLERVHWVGESSGGIVGILLAAEHPERIASLVLCNTPTRIPDRIRQIYALGHANAGAAMRALGTGEWCRRTLSYRLDSERAAPELGDWVVAEMDRTRPDIAAALHDCFETVDALPLLPRVAAPVLLLSGDRSRISSDQQRAFLDALPDGRAHAFAGYGHGVNLILPEDWARASLEFWRTIESADHYVETRPVHRAAIRRAAARACGVRRGRTGRRGRRPPAAEAPTAAAQAAGRRHRGKRRRAGSGGGRRRTHGRGGGAAGRRGAAPPHPAPAQLAPPPAPADPLAGSGCRLPDRGGRDRPARKRGRRRARRRRRSDPCRRDGPAPAAPPPSRRPRRQQPRPSGCRGSAASALPVRANRAMHARVPGRRTSAAGSPARRRRAVPGANPGAEATAVRVADAGAAATRRGGRSASSTSSIRWSTAGSTMSRRKAVRAGCIGRSSSAPSPIWSATRRCRRSMCCSATAPTPNFPTSGRRAAPSTRPSSTPRS